MSSYDALAASYDGLMADGVYLRRAAYLERLFRRSAIPVRTVLDLGCGTGTIACLLSQRGYRVTATDLSEEMLTQAADKGADRAYLALGKLYTSEKKTEDAKAAFQKYMEKHPKDADALEQLASIAADAGDYADAATYYKDAMEAASGDQVKELQKALVAVYEKNGDFASALEEAKDYVADYPEDETMQKEYEFLQTRVLTGLENTGTDNTQQADDTAADTTTEGNGQ